MIKLRYPLNPGTPETEAPPALSAANFCQTPLGRAMLHLECLCHHPAAARFHCRGLTRNLGECISASKSSTLHFLRQIKRRALDRPFGKN
jgi:hypothetical protein